MGSFANADEGTRRRLRAIVVFMRSPAANESPNQRRAMPGKNRGYRSDLACCSYRLSSGKSNPQKLKSCKNSKPTSVCPAVPVEPRCTTRALVPRFPSGHQRKICSSTAKPARVLSQSSMTGNDDRLSHFNSGLGRCYSSNHYCIRLVRRTTARDPAAQDLPPPQTLPASGGYDPELWSPGHSASSSPTPARAYTRAYTEDNL